MEITYKYKIGQKVKVVNKNNSHTDFRKDEYLEKIIGKEVTIINRGFELIDISDKYKTYVNKTGAYIMYGKYALRIFYYIEEDPVYNEQSKNYADRTRINEICLSGDEANETIDEEFKSADGYDIIPDETVVYEDIINTYIDENNKRYYEANCNFVFANEGIVFGLRKNWELKFYKDYEDDIREICTFRTFLCHFEPDENGVSKPCMDARKYGNTHWQYLRGQYVYVKIPENFPEMFVNSALKSKFYKDYNIFEDANFKWEIRQWLTHFKIYNKTKRLYKEKMSPILKEKTKQKKEIKKIYNKMSKFVSKLSDIEIEQLKQILNV